MFGKRKLLEKLAKSSIHVNDAFLDKIIANSESTSDAFGHIMDIEGNFLKLACIYDELLDFERVDLIDLESMERRYGRTDKKR